MDEETSVSKGIPFCTCIANIFPDKLHKKFFLVTDQKVFVVL